MRWLWRKEHTHVWGSSHSYDAAKRFFDLTQGDRVIVTLYSPDGITEVSHRCLTCGDGWVQRILGRVPEDLLPY